MPRRKSTRRRRKFNLRGVRITPELPLDTLTSDTVVLQGVSGVSTSTYRAVSLKTTWGLSGLTVGQGPITVGYAHSDYTATEIAECLTSQAAIDAGLKIEQEKTNRLVRVVGTFSGSPNSVLNDGEPISTRLNWLIAIGKQVVIFAFNEDTATLTTGAVLNVQGRLWVKDSA